MPAEPFKWTNSAIARRKVELAARALSDLHSMKREEAYQSMMKEAECYDKANRHKAAWQLINMAQAWQTCKRMHNSLAV